jgi:hypothetical protein
MGDSDKEDSDELDSDEVDSEKRNPDKGDSDKGDSDKGESDEEDTTRETRTRETQTRKTRTRETRMGDSDKGDSDKGGSALCSTRGRADSTVNSDERRRAPGGPGQQAGPAHMDTAPNPALLPDSPFAGADAWGPAASPTTDPAGTGPGPGLALVSPGSRVVGEQGPLQLRYLRRRRARRPAAHERLGGQLWRVRHVLMGLKSVCRGGGVQTSGDSGEGIGEGEGGGGSPLRSPCRPSRSPAWRRGVRQGPGPAGAPVRCRQRWRTAAHTHTHTHAHTHTTTE